MKAGEVLPGIVSRSDPGDSLRIWVPGCATGEEAYSLGMLATEALSAANKRNSLQVFATDVDEQALATARLGIYPESIESDVAPARLSRFFRPEDHAFRVVEELREDCVFATQNLLGDAPFSKLDLISCRNLLIYIEPEVQKRLVLLFHFALKPNGILFLGASETINFPHQELFEPVSKKYRIYRRIGAAIHGALLFPVSHRQAAESERGVPELARTGRGPPLDGLMRTALLKHHAPAAVLADRRYRGLFFAGPADRYFRVTGGPPSQNILEMARDGLRGSLRRVVDAVIRSGQDYELSGVRIKRNGEPCLVRLAGHSIDSPGEPLALVALIEEPAGATAEPEPGAREEQSSQRRAEELERELEATRQELENTIRELQLSNEELRAANEEAMSMNEEFQSTNEELETSKEELQSLNEELTTINNQLQEKVEEHRVTNNDLVNLISSTDMATLFLDRELRIKRFTPSAKRLFNVISSDVDRSLSDITRRFSDSSLFEDAERVLRGADPIQGEVLAESGEWFNRRIVPYRAEGQGIEGVVITLAEITTLKRSQIAIRDDAEASSRMSRERLQRIADAAPMLIGYVDREERFRMHNVAYERWLGRPAQEIAGARLRDIMGEPAYAVLKPHLELALAGSRSRFEARLDLEAIGQRDIIAEYVPEPPGAQRPEGVFTVVLDVTELKRAQETLIASESRMRAVLETAPEAIFTLEETGSIESFSASAEQLFGYSAREVVGKNVRMLIPPLDGDEGDNYMGHVLGVGHAGALGTVREVDLRKKDGTTIPGELAIGEAYLDGSRLFTAFLRDVTERKRLETELRQSQKMEAVGQLTGGVAHDFNNLLTVILGNLELLQEDDTRNDWREGLLGEIGEAAELAARLTRRLLGFTRKGPLAVEVVDLNALLRHMEPIIRRTLEEWIEISIHGEEQLAPTRVDASQFENAVFNLVLNARDAMPEGGELRIDTANVELEAGQAAEVPGLPSGRYVLLTVTDTGVGMTPEVQARAFEPFFTTKGLARGTGLGLGMVQGLTRQLGGQVSLESRPGVGTSVRLYLPSVTDAEVSRASPPTRPEAPRASGETVLVVEDDPLVRSVAVKHLEALGYRVLKSESGRHALALLESGAAPDLVLSDVVMPGGMSGFALAKEIQERYPAIRIVLASGYAAVADEAHHWHGDIIEKPYKQAELARKIRDALNS